MERTSTLAPRKPIAPPVTTPPETPLDHPDVKSQLELNSTQVSPAVARTMGIAFIAVVLLIPLLDIVTQVARRQRVQSLDVVRPVPQALRAIGRGEGRAAWNTFKPILDAQYLHSYEEALGDHAAAKQFFQPRLQDVLTGKLQFGNDKGVVGRDGWLYYQPGIDYLSGPGFLGADRLRLRAQKMSNKGEKDPHPDPRPAILRFHEDCRKAGVHLVIVPVPDKAMLQPEHLSGRMAFDQPIKVPNNRDFPRFVDELRAAGVDVFDPTPRLLNPGDVRYLIQDTHWTPQFMGQVAADLAAHIRGHLPAPASPTPVTTEARRVSRLGDIVGMLKLSQTQAIFRAQEVMIEQVQDAEGHPWQPSRTADVLLLGDSFTNIYSDGEGQEGLGWGQSAGLAPQLSRHLGRPIDVIARNGSGASVTRGELARRADPFGGKKVIVWQFAIRDLACENWQVIPIDARPSSAPPVTAAGELVLEAELVTPVPPQATKTEVYVNALVVLKFSVRKVEAGGYTAKTVLVKMPSIIDRQVQPAVQIQPKQVFRLKLKKQAPAKYETWQSVDKTGDFGSEPMWVEEIRRIGP